MLVSLALRRFGPRVGGLFGGLPVVAGPILLIYALDHGDAFAADAAASSLVALVALTAFVLVTAWLGERLGAVRSVVVGWAAFLVVGWLGSVPGLPPVGGAVLCAAAFVAALAAFPGRVDADDAVAAGRPEHDLLLRAVLAAAMVAALTSVAGQLGPTASGILAPFPIITSVLAGFATAHESRATTLALLRGMVRGFWSFAAFLFTLAVALEPLGTAGAFASAIAATVAVQLVLLRRSGRSARV